MAKLPDLLHSITNKIYGLGSSAVNAAKGFGNDLSVGYNILAHPNKSTSIPTGSSSTTQAGGKTYTNFLPTIGPATNPGLTPEMQANLAQYAAAGQINDLQSRIDALQNPAPTPLPTLPDFNVEDTFAKAKAAANSSVSPYYEQALQTFKDQQALRKQRAQEDLNATNAAIDTQLANQQANDQVTQQRTTQDTTTNIGNLNTAENNYQLDSANGFRKAFNNLRAGQAQSGLTFSGIAGQDQNQALKEKAIAEGRNTAATNNQIEAQNLAKTRTFEDIARSEAQATAAGATSKKNASVNFDRLAQDIIAEELQKERDLEFQKQQTIAQQTPLAAQNLFNKYIAQLRSPEQVNYATSLYGGLF